MNAIFRIRVIGVAMLAAAMVSNLGCAKMSWKPAEMFSLDNTWPFRDENEPQEGTPTRMTATWADTVCSQPGKKSQRGFGGRVTFYEKDEKKPILVDGELVVYAFDETDREPTDTKPTRRYVFPADQIPLHMSKNEFGASYSFFLPWDEAGGPRTEVSLICRFAPKKGSLISSEQARVNLPGTMAPVAKIDGRVQPPKLPEGVEAKQPIQTLQALQEKRMRDRDGAKQASYEAAVAVDPQAALANGSQDPAALPAKKLTATTINLPGTYQLPTAAEIANQPIPGAANAHAMALQYQQPAQLPIMNQSMQPLGAYPLPAAGALPAAGVLPAGTIAPVPTGACGPTGMSRAFPGTQPMLSPNGALPGAGQLPLGSQPTMLPVTQPMTQLPAGYSLTPATQTPMMQQQAQQAAQQQSLQQQLMQQQLMQQQALQQRMLPQSPVVAPTASQIPLQAGGAATINYPAGAQYLR
ncbi:MAG: hypothetical protein U0805_11855 [Pirellulales bacterium]